MCCRQAFDGVTHPMCRRRYAPDGLTSLVRYRGVVRAAVKAVKYRSVEGVFEQVFRTIPLTSHNLIETIRRLCVTMIIPVPLHKARLRSRGFNQARIIADFIGRIYRIPVRVDILERTRSTVSQTEVILRDSRLGNVRKVFSVRASKRSEFVSASILLVDDVFTTGATARDAVRALKRAGAHTVWIATLAR